MFLGALCAASGPGHPVGGDVRQSGTIVCVTGRAAGNNPADAHDVIRVVGARENNLRGVDVVIPKRRLTVFTGVSGSGKSSLVFATIAAESRRLVNETYPAFVQGFMETGTRPDVDRLEGLTPAIVVVIEHHQAVMAHADWILDLGPGAGHDGGRVVFTGTPAQMAAERSTLTGKYLARYVEEVNDDAPE